MLTNLRFWISFESSFEYLDHMCLTSCQNLNHKRTMTQNICTIYNASFFIKYNTRCKSSLQVHKMCSNGHVCYFLKFHYCNL
jgi:hypothetical protein